MDVKNCLVEAEPNIHSNVDQATNTYLILVVLSS